MPIQTIIQHYGYIGVIFIFFIEMIGIPFPAETTLILSGIMWTHGVFKLLPLIIAANIGNILGSVCAYAIGCFLVRPMVVRFGKYVGLTNERFDRGNLLFANYQVLVVLFGKFIAGIRVLIPYIAGINKIPFLSFSIYNTISSLLWTTAFIFIGKYLGETWSNYSNILDQYIVPTIVVAVFLVVGFFGFKIWRKRRSKNISAKSSESSRYFS